MPDTWYYVQDQQTVGPVTLADLQRVLAGAARPADMLVWADGFAEWRAAGSVDGLIDVGPPEATDQMAEAAAPVAMPKAGFTGGKIWGYAASFIAAVIGVALSRAFGAIVWLPLGIAFGFWLLTRLKTSSLLVPPLAVAMGHLIWFLGSVVLVAVLKVYPQLTLDAFVEAILVSALLVWAITTESKASIVSLIGVELFGLTMNAYTLSTTPHEALYFHIALRAFVVCFAGYAVVEMHRPSAEAA